MGFVERIERRKASFWVRDRWHAGLIDKWQARQFAIHCNVSVPGLYWHGHDPSQIRFSAFPRRYVAKGTRGTCSYNVFVMVDGCNLITGDRVTESEILLRFAQSKNRERETFLVEEFISTDQHCVRLPLEYKLHVFGGFIGAIQAIDRNTNRQRFYTDEWSTFDFQISTSRGEDTVRAAPERLEQLVSFSRTMGRAYGRYIRLDFFESAPGFVFGEMCATPMGGRCFTPEADDYFGALWESHLGNRL